MTIGELFDALCAALSERHEAVIVLEEAAGERLVALFPRFRNAAPHPLAARALELADRRGRGEPLQHVLGHWPFRHLELLQDGRALIARPETEVLVEVALGELARHAKGPPRRAIDLGTGSGAIALSLVDEVDDLLVLASDRSSRALELAAANRLRLAPGAAERVCLVAADWLAGLGPAALGSCALVTANPPYLSRAEWEGLDPVVKDYDPPEALVAGSSGLEAIDHLLGTVSAYLCEGGSFVCEIGAAQGDASRELALRAGAEVRIAADLAGRDRVLVARF